jgi:UDP-GlcNAc3NAcA epimerase
MKIATVIGARPQFIKAATVSRIIKHHDDITETIIHTGQHYDANMSDVFFSELKIPRPNYNLEVGSGSHGRQTGIMLERIEQVLLREEPDWVLTYGDTNSTLAGALAAAKLHIPAAHVEAGLRSFNRLMPEEINRIATDHISDLLMAPTQNALQLLDREGLREHSVFTGDVMFDSLLFYRDIIDERHSIPEAKTLNRFYLATIHRPENTDDPKRLQSIFEALCQLDYPVLLPLHPRTRKLLNNIKFNQNIILIQPVSYLQMIFLLTHCYKVLTDSGGLQKEAYLMKKPCITLRDQSEWVETLPNNWNFIVGADTNQILEKISVTEYGPQDDGFGDGHAAEKVVQALKKEK